MNSTPSPRRSTDENPRIALDTLLHFLGKKQFEDLKQYLTWDFFTRLNSHQNDSYVSANKTSYYQRYISLTQPEAIHPSMIPATSPIHSDREIVDVAFVAIIKEELDALKAALGIPLDKPEDYAVNGMRFWKTKLSVLTQNQPINVIITMVGTARALECAVAMSTVFSRHTIGLCILVGIAAGLKTKTTIGDVVVAEMILDYEGQRLEPTGPKKRPHPYPLHPMIKRDLGYFNPVGAGWHTQFAKILPLLYSTNPTLLQECAAWNAKYIIGVVLAGGSLLADGSLVKLQKKYGERVRAAEQEGSGFARMCDEKRIPWLVFRGISDYGETPKPEQYQTAAALSAAICAVTFVQRDY